MGCARRPMSVLVNRVGRWIKVAPSVRRIVVNLALMVIVQAQILVLVKKDMLSIVLRRINVLLLVQGVAKMVVVVHPIFVFAISGMSKRVRGVTGV